jgi:hypothetical protein
LPDGLVGVEYEANVSAFSVLPLTWSITSGSLPGGLSLDASTGQITGTPTTPTIPPVESFTIQVADNRNQTDSEEFTVAIADTTDPRVVRVSLASDGSQANSDSGTPALSGDGRFVAFTSFADDFDTVLPPTPADIFSATTIGNSTLALTPAAHVGQRVQIVEGTAAGLFRTITENTATTLTVDPEWATVPDDTSVFRIILPDNNGFPDIFVTALDVSGDPITVLDTVRVSVASDGITAANSQSFSPALSSVTAGTLFVAYASDASNLVPGDNNNQRDVFVTALNISGGSVTVQDTARVSVATDGAEGDGASQLPAISADGLVVAYTSNATTLAPADNNNAGDAFVTELSFPPGGTLSVTRTRRVSLFPERLAVGIPPTLAETALITENTIGNSMLAMEDDEHIGRLVIISQGTGVNQLRDIVDNDATTLTVSPPWDTANDDSILIDETSEFRILRHILRPDHHRRVHRQTQRPAGQPGDGGRRKHQPGRRSHRHSGRGSAAAGDGQHRNPLHDRSPLGDNPISRRPFSPACAGHSS